MKKLFVFLKFFFLSTIGYFLLNRLIWGFIFGNASTEPIYKEIATSAFIGIFLAISFTLQFKGKGPASKK
jgi:hypothetical protein